MSSASILTFISSTGARAVGADAAGERLRETGFVSRIRRWRVQSPPFTTLVGMPGSGRDRAEGAAAARELERRDVVLDAVVVARERRRPEQVDGAVRADQAAAGEAGVAARKRPRAAAGQAEGRVALGVRWGPAGGIGFAASLRPPGCRPHRAGVVAAPDARVPDAVPGTWPGEVAARCGEWRLPYEGRSTRMSSIERLDEAVVPAVGRLDHDPDLSAGRVGVRLTRAGCHDAPTVEAVPSTCQTSCLRPALVLDADLKQIGRAAGAVGTRSENDSAPGVAGRAIGTLRIVVWPSRS